MSCWSGCFTDAVLQLFPPASGEPDLEALYAHAPGLRLNMVTSVDGAATLRGESAPLSAPADRTVFHLLRAQADVILVGAGTARDESYRPAKVTPERQEQRLARGQSPRPPIAVVTSGPGLPDGHPLCDAPDDLLLLRMSAEEAVAELRKRGLHRILCEGGPTLNGALLAARLVDEVCLTTSPLLVGGDAPRLAAGDVEHATAMTLAHLLLAGDMLLARWLVAASQSSTTSLPR